MSYENAPATRMLATHCAACARPLVDAVSVETGMGPDCRKRLLPTELVNEELRAEANKIVHDLAVGVSVGSLDMNAAHKLRRLQAIGFTGLVEKFLKNQALIFIEERGDILYVKTPFDIRDAVMGKLVDKFGLDRHEAELVEVIETINLTEANRSDDKAAA